MVDSFTDKFNRVDGELGSNYLIACGQAYLFDEAVLPVKVETIAGSEVLETPLQRTQVFFDSSALDGADQLLRAVWGHDAVVPAGVDSPPSFTILARATKDPLVIDLTPPEESPDCFDQFYGARVTCPLDGSAPVIKIVKKQPFRRMPGLLTPGSAEEDNAEVLTSIQIPVAAMNIDPTWDETGDYPYRGFWQDMRFRVRHGDDQVILEVFLNDRYQNVPILSFTDHADPLWSSIGLPGFEFLSATLSAQPPGASPFAEAAQALMRCTLFSAQTLKVFRKPVSVQPNNFWTYDRVVSRVIELVEKDGDGRYNASNSGATKRETYLKFVFEAEADIIRTEGYYHWLKRSGTINLVDQQRDYELPADVGEVIMVRPKNFVSQPLREMEPYLFHRLLAGRVSNGGKPSIYIYGEESVNNRRTIQIFPVPLIESIGVNVPSENPALEVDYYARQMMPDTPGTQLPFVPQQHIDVLVYGATAHALTLDTDEANSMRMANLYASKLATLRRENNRKISSRQTVMRSAADIFIESEGTRLPLLRATQLQNFFI